MAAPMVEWVAPSGFDDDITDLKKDPRFVAFQAPMSFGVTALSGSFLRACEISLTTSGISFARRSAATVASVRRAAWSSGAHYGISAPSQMALTSSR
jgi:hypothetical protein